mmetsp:Transcript_33114/g.30019  ORF Transcript_33114/g.30019 Transcript_33114/m.30019 type:complete len:219 (+) Transcript_33114:604-1260(+)
MTEVAALSQGITSIVGGIFLLIYAKLRNYCPESLSLNIDWKNLKFWEFTVEVLISGSSLYIETIALEISAIIISLLNDDATIAAHTAVLNCLYVFVEFFYGIGLVSNSIAGQAAGENNHKKAKCYTIVGIIDTLIFSIIYCSFLYWGGHHVAGLYSSNKEIQELIVAMLGIFAMGNVADSTANNSAIILRAVGAEKYVLYSFMFAYYVIGLPGGYVTS